MVENGRRKEVLEGAGWLNLYLARSLTRFAEVLYSEFVEQVASKVLLE